jgi:hypothetical protein
MFLVDVFDHPAIPGEGEQRSDVLYRRKQAEFDRSAGDRRRPF